MDEVGTFHVTMCPPPPSPHAYVCWLFSCAILFYSTYDKLISGHLVVLHMEYVMGVYIIVFHMYNTYSNDKNMLYIGII
jgi:hypothetical protein